MKELSSYGTNMIIKVAITGKTFWFYYNTIIKCKFMFQLTPIYDGSDRTICGNELIQPVRVTSDGRILEVVFGTNSKFTGRGFAARFRQIAGRHLLLVKLNLHIQIDSVFCQATLYFIVCFLRCPKTTGFSIRLTSNSS